MLKRMLCALLVLSCIHAYMPRARAFANAEAILTLTLPAALQEIGEEAFAASAAQHVVIPDGAKSIGKRAFADCAALNCIEIPASVVEIAADAFEGSENLYILCEAGSTAAFCAELYGIPWKEITQQPEEPEQIPVQTVTLNTSELSLSVGDSAALNATVLPETAANRQVTWSSSDAAVASVQNGYIQAIAPGLAVITAEAADGSGAKASCTVRVNAHSGIISFTGLAGGSSSTNMYLYVKATAPASGAFSAMGIRVWDAEGKRIVDYQKAITGSSKSSQTVWFDVFGDTGVAFAPDTHGTCQMYVVYNGVTYWTDMFAVYTTAAQETVTLPDKDQMVANLQNCSNTSIISTSKKLAMVTMADALLGEGYDPAFVAGVLANIYHEGTFGKFESSKYSSNEPAYLVYMDENYDYRNKYSNKLIYEGISLSELSAMLDELAAAGFPGKFGLGSVQWTGGRTRNLVALYIQEAAGSDTITLDQAIAAEVKMIKNELAGSYKSIYTKWKTAYAADTAADDAACAAGYRVCVSYEVPATYRSKAITRGQKAIQVYKVMLGLL